MYGSSRGLEVPTLSCTRTNTVCTVLNWCTRKKCLYTRESCSERSTWLSSRQCSTSSSPRRRRRTVTRVRRSLRSASSSNAGRSGGRLGRSRCALRNTHWFLRVLLLCLLLQTCRRRCCCLSRYCCRGCRCCPLSLLFSYSARLVSAS